MDDPKRMRQIPKMDQLMAQETGRQLARAYGYQETLQLSLIHILWYLPVEVYVRSDSFGCLLWCPDILESTPLCSAILFPGVLLLHCLLSII